MFVLGFVVVGLDYRFHWLILPAGFIIAKRIKSEEQFLEKETASYSEYMKKVKYRFIPFVW